MTVTLTSSSSVVCVTFTGTLFHNGMHISCSWFLVLHLDLSVRYVKAILAMYSTASVVNTECSDLAPSIISSFMDRSHITSTGFTNLSVG